MRGKVAKELRAFAKLDTPDLPTQTVYTAVATGQEWKKVQGITPNLTIVMDECQRKYYKLLKKIWKAV